MISRRSRRSVWLRANFKDRSCADPCGPEAHNPETHDPTTHDPETYDSTTHDPKTRDPKEARVQEARGQEARVQEARGQEASDQEARDQETENQMAYDQEAHHPETRARAQSKPEVKKTNKKNERSLFRVGIWKRPSRKGLFCEFPLSPNFKVDQNILPRVPLRIWSFSDPAQSTPEIIVNFEVGGEGGRPGGTIVLRWSFLDPDPVPYFDHQS